MPFRPPQVSYYVQSPARNAITRANLMSVWRAIFLASESSSAWKNFKRVCSEDEEAGHFGFWILLSSHVLWDVRWISVQGSTFRACLFSLFSCDWENGEDPQTFVIQVA